MRRVREGLIVLVCALAGGIVWAQEAHEHGAAAPEHEAAAQEQTLTGEVVDVFCYLSHPKEGIGEGHAGCAKKCIKSGLPVAIKVGDQLYLATMSDHNPANQQLADLAAARVTVRGKVMELDGQRLIAVSSVEKAE
ncbi:MAG TPA: hypothetical protein VJA19_05395 [Pseudomonas sp.]|nr:hypothetical protein [Pseudomonas sp.]